MINTKTEEWNGHKIRFVEKDGEWWAVAKDVAEALGYAHTPHMTRLLEKEEKDAVRLTDTIGRTQIMTIISEVGIYEAIFGSEKIEAKEFKKWVKQTLKTLRQSSGLEGFQVFRMLDREHQKEMMSKLNRALKRPVQVDFIKANTVANKATSLRYGYQKMIKKADMTPDMLVDRQDLLESTVELMSTKEKFDLEISVSREVYKLATGQIVR